MNAAWTLILMAPLALCACAAPSAPPGMGTTGDSPAATAPKRVFISRHMQKGEGDDPSLTTEGAANAERLAAMLAGQGISAIFSTPTRRTMETAAPLAEQLGIAVTPYDPGNPEALAEAVAAAPGPVLVVGHSNTVPELVARFGGAKPAPMSEEEFGILFVVAPNGDVTRLEVR